MNQKTGMTDCPICRQRKLMTGRWAKYNARNVEGKQICTDCKVNEMIQTAFDNRSL